MSYGDVSPISQRSIRGGPTRTKTQRSGISTLSRSNTPLSRSDNSATAASSIYPHYASSAPPSRAASVLNKVFSRRPSAVVSAVDLDAASKVSWLQALERCFLPGWVKKNPYGGNGSVRERISRNFFAVLIGSLVPLTLLLPLVPLRFEVTSDGDRYYVVSLLQSWWGYSNSKDNLNQAWNLPMLNSANMNADLRALPDQLIVTALWIQVLVGFVLLLVAYACTAWMGMQSDPSKFRFSQKSQGKKIWGGISLATTLQLFVCLIVLVVIGVMGWISTDKFQSKDYFIYIGLSGGVLLCAIISRAICDYFAAHPRTLAQSKV